MANIMDRWMRESLNALEMMEAQRAEHEAAMEAAMDAIRRHTSEIERLERDIAVVKEALQSVSLEAQAEGAPSHAAPPATPPAALAGPSSLVHPPAPPPLRPLA